MTAPDPSDDDHPRPDQPGDQQIAMSVTINGQRHDLEISVRRTLAEVIREEIGLTGTHLGCEHGVCGACTVAIGGRPVRSCLMLAIQADRADITTIEGLAVNGELHPIQQGMHDAHGFQCAFCAPGFLITAACMLETNPSPTRDQIREELSGNLCRCTGYHSIIEGVETAVRLIQSSTTVGQTAEGGDHA